MHAVGKLPRHITGVVGKCQRRIARLPAALQRRRQVPVEERDVGRDAVGQQLVHHALVIVQARGIRLALALGKIRDQEIDIRYAPTPSFLSSRMSSLYR